MGFWSPSITDLIIATAHASRPEATGPARGERWKDFSQDDVRDHEFGTWRRRKRRSSSLVDEQEGLGILAVFASGVSHALGMDALFLQALRLASTQLRGAHTGHE